MEYYSAIEKERGWVICKDVDGPRDVIQSEVSQKQNNKYRILTHICGIQKNGIDELICNTEIETQT